MVRPDYYDKFACIGGKCIHNCCRGGWEIEIDDESMERFSNLSGEFGERVRAAINDEHIFIHKNGHCPLLTDDGWCEMAQRGEQLCIICDEYPRFTEYFDDYAERGISLSCEAAADLILNSRKKTTFICDCEPPSDEPLLLLLINAREKIFEILQDRSMDIFTRLRLMLDYGRELQENINNNILAVPEYTPSDKSSEISSLAPYIALLKELTVLNDEWLDMLDSAQNCVERAVKHSIDDIMGEQLAVYFVFRYLIKAAYDYDALSKLKFSALSVMMIASLAAASGKDIYECARLYSIEIEHSEENIESIYDEFLFSPELSYENILSMIR